MPAELGTESDPGHVADPSKGRSPLNSLPSSIEQRPSRHPSGGPRGFCTPREFSSLFSLSLSRASWGPHLERDAPPDALPRQTTSHLSPGLTRCNQRSQDYSSTSRWFAMGCNWGGEGRAWVGTPREDRLEEWCAQPQLDPGASLGLLIER